MKAVVVPERSFCEAFRQAEYDINKAIHEAANQADASPVARLSLALSNMQLALHKLRDRLIETQL